MFLALGWFDPEASLKLSGEEAQSFSATKSACVSDIYDPDGIAGKGIEQGKGRSQDVLLSNVFALLEALSHKRELTEGLFGSSKGGGCLAKIKLRISAVVAAKPAGSMFDGKKVLDFHRRGLGLGSSARKADVFVALEPCMEVLR